MQARAPSNAPPAAPMLLGSFQTVAGQQTLDCDAVGAAATVILSIILQKFCWALIIQLGVGLQTRTY